MKKFFQDPQLSKKLQQVEQSDVENLTLDELEDRYHEVKLALSNDNSTGIIGFGYGYHFHTLILTYNLRLKQKEIEMGHRIPHYHYGWQLHSNLYSSQIFKLIYI